MQEFIDNFHLEYTTLQEEIEELELRIKDQEHRAGQIEGRLAEQKKTEKYTQSRHPAFPELQIMKQSILSVHLVDARELRPAFGRTANAQVRTSIEGNRDATKDTVLSNNPVWNEVITFDIE